MRNSLHAAILVAAMMSVTRGPMNAQTIHVPPAYRSLLPRDSTVLTLSIVRTGGNGVASSQSRRDSTAGGLLQQSPGDDVIQQSADPKQSIGQVTVDDDQLVLQVDDKIIVVPLSNRSIRDVMNQLVADVGELKGGGKLKAVSNYPLHPATNIGSYKATDIALGHPVHIKAAADEPDLRIGFGVVMSLANPSVSADDSGILTQAGFQLDIVGAHQTVGQRPNDAKWFRRMWPVMYTQWRVGLNSDQQIQTKKEDSASDQIAAALAQADQIAIGGQADMYVARVGSRLDVIISPSYALNWTRLHSPPVPRVLKGGRFVTADSVFTPDALDSTRSDWRRIKPLDEKGAMVMFQYRRHDVPAYYVGAGLMRRELLLAGVTYRRSPNADGTPGEPIPESLRGTLNRSDVWVWRAAVGTRLAGVVDLRVDASASIEKVERVDPLLRVLIARAFPIGQ